MKHTIEEYKNKLQEFIKRWSIYNFQKMELKEYTGIGNHDTFCYWVEIKTGILGSIKGIPSSKFGIYKRKNEGLPSKKCSLLIPNTHGIIHMEKLEMKLSNM